MGMKYPICLSERATRNLKPGRTTFYYFCHVGANQNEILEKVRAFAETAHGSQMRKYSDEKYINHPIRVMETCREYTQETPVLAAALLHDVVEDTKLTRHELSKFLTSVMGAGLATITHHLVMELTDVYIKSDYPKLNRRSRRTKEAVRLSGVSPDAQTVKYADVIDNVVDIARHDTDFALVYIRESKQLLQQIDKGNPLLYQRAIQTVDDALQAFFTKANIKSL
jgi:guanosine-3',5'-bis(diphosphate) 3'-pyrophosphohydrolase